MVINKVINLLVCLSAQLQMVGLQVILNKQLKKKTRIMTTHNTWILYGKFVSFANFTSSAATRLESRPPDSKQPIRRSAMRRFWTAAVSSALMLAWTSLLDRAAR
jgi:hypothetical protein